MFIKDLDIGEVWANYTKSYITSSMGEACKNEFTVWNSAYLQRESSMTDADPEDNMISTSMTSYYYSSIAKHYI